MSPDLKICKNCAVFVLVLCTCLLLPSHLALASDDKEIDFLLSYIAESDCLFIRNGNEHQAGEAREHLEMKYSHIREHIKTAEDFIDRVASESSLTGKPYQVVCGKKKSLTKNWLNKALSSYRLATQN